MTYTMKCMLFAALASPVLSSSVGLTELSQILTKSTGNHDTINVGDIVEYGDKTWTVTKAAEKGSKCCIKDITRGSMTEKHVYPKNLRKPSLRSFEEMKKMNLCTKEYVARELIPKDLKTTAEETRQTDEENLKKMIPKLKYLCGDEYKIVIAYSHFHRAKTTPYPVLKYICEVINPFALINRTKMFPDYKKQLPYLKFVKLSPAEKQSAYKERLQHITSNKYDIESKDLIGALKDMSEHNDEFKKYTYKEIITRAGISSENSRQNIANEIKRRLGTEFEEMSKTGVDALVHNWDEKPEYNNRVGCVYAKKEQYHEGGKKMFRKYQVSINAEDGNGDSVGVLVPRENLIPLPEDVVSWFSNVPARGRRRLLTRLRESRRRRLAIIRRLQGF